MDTELGKTISDIQEMYREDADKSKLVFKTSSNLGGRFRSDVKIRDHVLTIDEPTAIGGSDMGAQSRRSGIGCSWQLPGDHLSRFRNGTGYQAGTKYRLISRETLIFGDFSQWTIPCAPDTTTSAQWSR